MSDIPPRQLPSVRIRGTADIVQAVPYLLGFHPSDSLVLIGLDDSTLVVTARVDLADIAGDAGRELLDSTLAAFSNGGVDHVLGVVYEPARGVAVRRLDPISARALGEACERARCVLDDLAVVADGRWWSCFQDGESAARRRRPPGRALPRDPSPFVAEATLAGVVAMPDRAALAATLRPLPDGRRERLRPMLDDTDAATDGVAPRAVRRAAFSTARLSAQPGWQFGLDEPTTVALGAALRDITLRDALWMAVEGRKLDGRPLWRELARRLPAPYDAPPLFIYAWASWRDGHGALAGMAAERALRSDPAYHAADMLLAAVAHGLDPRRVPRLHRGGRAAPTVA